jgi:hypothetical protein
MDVSGVGGGPSHGRRATGSAMNNAARTLIAAGALAVFSNVLAVAHADPDPHMPNGKALWCQGGLGNDAMIPYCDGEHFPDGSFWHQTAASPFGIGGPASLPWNEPVLVKP